MIRQHSSELSRQAEEGTMIMLELASMKQPLSDPEREGETRRKVVVLNGKSEFHQPLGGIRTTTSYLRTGMTQAAEENYFI